MLNYSLNKEQSRKFILGYEPTKQDLNIFYGNGDSHPIPNTPKNEQQILEKMEKQVIDSWEFRHKQSDRKLNAIMALACSTVGSICGLLISFLTGVNPFGVIIIIGGGIAAGISGYIVADSSDYLDDIKKNKLFIDNKEKINNYYTVEPELVASQEINLVANPQKKEALTINDIDEMSYQDVVKIIDDIDRDWELGIKREKVLLKKPIYNNRNKENGTNQ